LSGKINATKETTKTVLVASREVCLEENTEKNEYILVPYEQSKEREHNLKMVGK
jgi:hypothetical protein